VVITPRRDDQGKPIGFLLISKDISHEMYLTEVQSQLAEERAAVTATMGTPLTPDFLAFALSRSRSLFRG